MEYKLSDYNIVACEKEKSKYIWNTKRGSIVELENDAWESLEKSDFQSEAVRQYLESLYKEGIIVNSELDEYEEIMFIARQRQYGTGQDSFGLVIAPTLACNYNCPYCFEHTVKDKKEMMDLDTMKSIYSALAKKLKANPQIKKLRFTWFGGEPLLAYERVIVPLQERIVKLCNEMGVTFTASIITNGYFLTEEKLEFLFKNNGTKFVQITLDGTEEEYCQRKGTTKEAFARVVNNILNLSRYCTENELNVKINIRLNVDNDNYEKIKQLVSAMREDNRFSEKIVFSLARLRKYDFCKEYENCCTTDEYEKILYDFEDFIEKPPYIIEPKKTFCGQHCMNVFCVGARGELYKCEHDFGIKEHSVGHIESGLTYNKYFTEFMEQPLPKKCVKCKLLPICMGGCPHTRLMNKGQIECEHTVENLKKQVIKYINNRR